MAKQKQNTTTAPAEETGKKRTVLTPAERVAKLEAELAEARKRAEAKANKQGNELKERRARLVEQITERKAKVDAIDAQLRDLGIDTTELVVFLASDGVTPEG